MNRREFLQSSAIIFASAVLGAIISEDHQVIEIVDYEIDMDAMEKSVTMSNVEIIDGKAVAHVSFDDQAARNAITLIDSNGNKYTLDQIEELIG